MADNKTYYYLKLRDTFYDSEDMKILESMKDGYMYSNIYLKLCLASLRNEGRLMYRGIIPYTSSMISSLTGHQVGTVEKAINIFKEMGLIEILDNGAIFISDIQSFIGKSSTEADRIRNYRKNINVEKAVISDSKFNANDSHSYINDSTDNVHTYNCECTNDITNERTNDVQMYKGGCTNVTTNVITNELAYNVQMYDKCTPENRDKRLENRDKSIELRDKENRDKSISLTVSKDTVRQTDVQRVMEEWNTLSAYGVAQISYMLPNTMRYKMLCARIKEYGLDKVISAIDMIRHRGFLQGKNKRGWVITFDWFVKPNNFPKVLEGNYKNEEDNSTSNRLDVVDGWV
jgi:predicted phage replisome organizer